MLPNHSTLKVAENFRLLEALYPGRIDLGLGRAPGGDRLTAQLLNPTNTFDPQEYISQLRELEAFLNETPSPGNFQGKVRAIPHIATRPELWMLTSSGESAFLAAHFGMGLCFAQFINPIGGPEAIRAYRNRFKASASLAEPKTAVGIFAFCSDDPRKVHETQALIDYRLLGFEKGNYDEIPTVTAALAYDYTPAEWQRVLHNRRRTAVGTPEQLREKLTSLAAEFETDEIVISTFTEKAADRFRSYELLAQLFELRPAEFPNFKDEANNSSPAYPPGSKNPHRATTP
jgi:luciferase family oxidoreductase group 1